MRPSGEVEEEFLSDGFVARLADRIFENPAMSGGLFVMALTAAGIVSNAMMMQNGHHPDPLFMTRPNVASRAPVPLPRARVEQPARPPVPLPPLRETPAAAPAAPDQKLIAEVQRALAGKRLYRGAADGIAGPHTRAAISAYEKSTGLPVTGMASADLLARLRTPEKQAAVVKPALPAKAAAPAAALPPVAAVPAAAVTVALPAATSGQPLPAPGRHAIEAIAASPDGGAAPAAVAPAALARQPAEPPAAPPPADQVPSVADAAPEPAAVDEAPPPAPPPSPPAAATAAPDAAAVPVAVAPVADAPPPPPPDPSTADRQRYRKIQNALNQAGYGPLKADGIANEQTAGAIRRFELDNGLPITGKPSERVSARLVSIGAMDAN
jgi:peptidoglycan hydrolase-like protein with peptidoglycan-binding domain